jgi:acetyl esterase/lipase
MPYAFATESVEYIRHGNTPYMMKLYKPSGDGPFPMVIDLHGGAWCNGDLADCDARDQVLAASGLVVAAANFRHASEGYPTSLADINFAIRWMKTNAAKLNGRADAVGLSGTSSGGHLAMLTAMRPNDPRYTAIASPAGGSNDPSVKAVVMQWPVINPISRYRNARRMRDSANPPAWVGNIPERHEQYWKTEAAMIEGNPIGMMERGEKVVTVPALWIQGQPDPVHDYRDPESPVELNEPLRFALNYRKAGGYIETLYVDDAEKRGNISHEPTAAFFHRFLK